MAGLEKLKDRILSDARLAAETNLAQARREADETILKAREEAQAKHSALIAKAERDAEEREKRLLSVAELEGRKEKLAVKQQLIDEVFAQAIKILCEEQDPDYEKLLVYMIARSAAGGEEVILSDSDRGRISPGFMASVNNMLVEKGKSGGLTLSGESRPIRGGFVLRSGQVEVNNSFESIIKMNRDDLEPLAVKMLFK